MVSTVMLGVVSFDIMPPCIAGKLPLALCGKMKLKTIQSKFRVIADQLGSSSMLPTRPPPDEGPYAEHIGDSYFYVVSERGFEVERRETKAPDELLSWFVLALTFEIAGDWELNHRIPAQDSRRLLFNRHVELLRGINESWADQQQAYYDDVLMRHPFDDASEDRVDYFGNLQKQGIDDEEAWNRALVKFPEPK